MFGHGTFIYGPDYALQKFGSAKNVAKAIQDLGMSHAWLRVHSSTGLWKQAENLKLAQALRAAGISVGVWGWNDGNDVQADIANMEEAISTFEPDCYIADIENEVSGARWSPAKAKTFGKAAKQALGNKPLVVSSFGYIRTHEPEIMSAIDQYADFFAPQVYWFWFPNAGMLDAQDLAGLPKNNPVAYTKVCLHYWRKAVTKPLVLTGQAYWGEASGWTQIRAEEKLAEFLNDFSSYDEIVGLNWWNFADPKAMSSKMIEIIKQADIGSKFAGPAPAVAGAAVRALPVAAATESRMAVVAAEGLYFRSAPEAKPNNIVAELDYGDRVRISGEANDRGFVKAVIDVAGGPTEGYVHQRYLRPEESEKIERPIREAVREWRRFNKGAGTETFEPYSSYINEYWTARHHPNITGKDTDQFWSAVFISFILENAGYDETQFDIRHSTYIHQAIQNRVTATDGDFWGYRLNEAKPEVGDIVCQWRGSETTFAMAETKSNFPGHTDIVIAVRPGAIITMGGNVANASSHGKGVTVGTKTFELDASGFLPDARRVFAIMKNRHRATPDVPIA